LTAVDYYAVLGVAPDATDAEIARSHKALALQFHPDRHPGASGVQRAQLDAAMTRINDAYNALKTPERRAAYDRERPVEHAVADFVEYGHAPGAGQCDLCGFEPARRWTFQHQSSWLFGRRVHTHRSTLCRDCARAVGRTAQSRTVITGWWGFISLFTNLGYVITNTSGLWKVRVLDAPKRRDGDVVAPLTKPMAAGRPVFLRAGFLALAGLLVLAGVQLSRHPHPAPAPPASQTVASWHDGACVARSGPYMHPTPCSGPSDGVVIAVEPTADLCPASATAYVDYLSRFYCIRANAP
jgi:DnaJ domain